MTTRKSTPQLLTVAEARRTYGVTPSTLVRWVKTGWVEPVHVPRVGTRFADIEIRNALRAEAESEPQPGPTPPQCCGHTMRRIDIAAPDRALTLHACGRCERRHWYADGQRVPVAELLRITEATAWPGGGKRPVAI